MKLLTALLALSIAVASPCLQAKRLGGGTSFGKQSGNVTQQHAAPSPVATPNGAAAQQVPSSNAARAPAAAQQPAAAPAKKPWGAMLGGLAAGLGLAWLASSLGMGEAFGQILMFILLGVVVMGVIGWVVRSRRPVAANPGGLAYQGAGAGNTPFHSGYSPNNVGNDASARPWERNTTNFESSRYADVVKPNSGSVIGSALSDAAAWGIPADFDVEGFLQASKANFIGLQAAWDRSDMASLRAMMTDDMLEQIKVQLAERERQSPGAENVTEVVMLEARLLGIESLDHDYMASVEFSGMMREDPSAGPSPFREVWNITRPRSGPGGWLVAGVQALQ